MLGSGVGTKGAGGPGILQTLGNVAEAMLLTPVVIGVLGGLTATVGIAYAAWFSNSTAPRNPFQELAQMRARGPCAQANFQASVASTQPNAPVAAPTSPH